MKTERELLFKRLNERFVRAFVTYSLLADGDHVLIGLSGGKDSLLLTELLAKRARINHPAFRVDAVHVRMENVSYETSTDYLQQFCDSLGVPLHIVTTSFSSDPSPITTHPSPVTLHPKKSPPAFSVPGIAARSFSIWLRNLAATKLLSAIIVTTSSTRR